MVFKKCEGDRDFQKTRIKEENRNCRGKEVLQALNGVEEIALEETLDEARGCRVIFDLNRRYSKISQDLTQELKLNEDVAMEDRE